MTEIKIQSTGETFTCDADDTILRAALRSGHGMSYSCNVGSCGNCKFELVEGSVTHAREDAPAWSERDLKRNKWLGCQARPNGPCTIKFRDLPAHVSRDLPHRRAARLLSVSAITHDISEFSFDIEGDDAFRPGQYALISIAGVDGARAYSMCNLPGEKVWNFQIRKVSGGAATEKLFAMQPGTELSIDGPYSTAYLREDIARDIVLMAGGSGLSPMVSIARGAFSAGMLDDRKLHFYYGCRAEADLIDPAVLGPELAQKVTFTAALSEAPANGTSYRTGFLHEVVAADFGDQLKNHEIYFAGPAVMSAAIQKMAYEAGVPQDQLHFDEFF